MADLLIKQSSLANDTVFRNRVELALFVTMVAVAAEAKGALSTEVFWKRHTHAVAVLTNPVAYVDRYAKAAASNSTIAAAIAVPIAVTSSTSASPSVVTTPTHGYTTGDTVSITGHNTNTSINGGWIITVLSSTTFSVPVGGVGAGGATGTVVKQPNDSDLQFTINSLVNDFAGVASVD